MLEIKKYVAFIGKYLSSIFSFEGYFNKGVELWVDSFSFSTLKILTHSLLVSTVFHKNSITI